MTKRTPNDLQSLSHFTEHRFEQLAVFDDGRTPIYLTEEQYNAIRDLVAQASAAPEQEPAVFVSADCLRNLRVSGFDSFSALLHRQQASMVSPQLVALYTHPDLSEVVKLRAEVREASNLADQWAENNSTLCRQLEAATQRADAAERKLSEALGLLQKAYTDIENTNGNSWCICCNQGAEDDGVITHRADCTFCAMEMAIASAEPTKGGDGEVV